MRSVQLFSSERQAGKSANIHQQLAKARLTALQAQMNPHFIFNGLNSIKRLILDNENYVASRYLSKFAHMTRLTLAHSNETFITLQETIDYLHEYLAMEQLRFGNSFLYQIKTEIDYPADDIDIPTLFLQPLAENAIWHGLLNKQGDKKLLIRFEQRGGLIDCCIEDNGIGILQAKKLKEPCKRQHIGLENLRLRIGIMNKIYSLCCTLDIRDLSEKNNNETGTVAVLRFKIPPVDCNNRSLEN